MIELRRRYSKADKHSYSRLPVGYKEVEYLDNSENPNAYLVIPEIVRGYAGSIIADISISSISTQQPAGRYKFVFGWSQGPQVVLDTMKWQNYYVGTYLADVGVKYKVQLDINDNISELFVDGTFITKNTTFDNDRGLHILNSHASNLGLFGRVYNLKSNGTVTIDLIPCYRISDHKPGMYDIVNDVFYTNAGTGEFLVGPDVRYNIPPEYQQVEYLEDTGTQIIVIPKVLGYGANDNFVGDIRAKISTNNTTTSTTPLPYKIAYGWGNGAQVGVKAPDLYWHNFGTMTTFPSAYLNIIYDTRLEILGKISNIYINDVYAGQTGVFNNSSYLTLFNATGANVHFFGRIYELTIQGTKNLTLIPCYRKADNVAGMYDLVSGEFYTNAGTGEFIVGPDVIG